MDSFQIICRIKQNTTFGMENSENISLFRDGSVLLWIGFYGDPYKVRIRVQV